ncbi:uncharacterized protein LOC110854263 [Folsomia candida]|uniref:Uncharacterized protein n=1 Tax=Folsomia candida TaxID=158441 RepID=A0A226DYI7_FOLCA|nr:uncharacterized protein LOC110854263 [Folsomia candida]OXA50289.1 hypothetical protein Fcan01_15295 [Folsomia candida]
MLTFKGKSKSYLGQDSDSVQINVDETVCQIWEDFDSWISKQFNQEGNNHGKENDTEEILNVVVSTSTTCLRVTLDDIESGIGDSADQCSSTCTLCNERKISNATTTAPQKQSRRQNEDRSRRRQSSNVVTLPPCFEGVLVFIFACSVLIVCMLWLSRFVKYEKSGEVSVPDTLPNWWVPLPEGGRGRVT